MRHEDQDTDMLDAQKFSAHPTKRKLEIAAKLLERNDLKTIEALELKIVTPDEIVGDPLDAIQIKFSN